MTSPVSSFSGFSSQLSGFNPLLDESSNNDDLDDALSDVSSVNTEDLSDVSDDALSFDDDEDGWETASELDGLDSQASQINQNWWSDEQNVVNVPAFEEDFGPQHDLAPTASALDFFLLFFPLALFDLMTTETNRYARQQQQTNGDDCMWTETDSAEMRAFIGVLIIMGIVQVPQYAMYWSKDSFLRNEGIASVFSVRRYEKLMQYFHLSNNETRVPRGQPGYDRLSRIRPILQTAHQTFLTHFKPGRDLSVDEGMVKYKGRFSMKQYMPCKPIKRGLKVWMLCEAVSGYCHRFEMYMGRFDPNRGRNLGCKVVMMMCKELKYKNHHVYFDKFFTSLELIRTLERSGIRACGAIKANAVGLPRDLRTVRLRRGESVTRQHGDIVATYWQDVKQVIFLSTNCSPTGDATTRRRVRDSDAVVINVPPAASLYQQNMAGVDRNNQHRAKYPVGRPAKKWWKYMFFFVVNLSLTNGFILWKKATNGGPGATMVAYHMAVAEGLISAFSSRKKKAGEKQANHLPPRGHICERLNAKRTTCKVCWSRRQRHTTVYGCPVCKIHLCQGACFVLYHNQNNIVIE